MQAGVTQPSEQQIQWPLHAVHWKGEPDLPSNGKHAKTLYLLLTWLSQPGLHPIAHCGSTAEPAETQAILLVQKDTHAVPTVRVQLAASYVSWHDGSLCSQTSSSTLFHSCLQVSNAAVARHSTRLRAQAGIWAAHTGALSGTQQTQGLSCFQS